MEALKYAKKAARAKTTPKYVKKQCREFINIAAGKDKKYIISEKKVKQIEFILKLLTMPKGLRAGETLYDCSTGYQWLFYTAVLAVVERENPAKRRYETGILEIARKNFKTYTVATLFILLFLTEPKFSQFFSVAPDGSLSRAIRDAIRETLAASPAVKEYKGDPRFRILRDSIEFLPTNTKYKPLAYSTSRLDGRLPNVFVADEVGALPSIYPIEAMRSGQLNILNKLGCIISTKYPTIDNPFEEEIKYGKKILDGVIKDDSYFCLFYEPDEEIRANWIDDDLVLKQANPAALESPAIFEDLKKKRAQAVEMESKRENFLTKHCNIIYQGIGTESFVDIKDVQACRVDTIDWRGRVVYVGLDLAQTTDNTAVSMVSAGDNGEILVKSVAFIPEGRLEEKSRVEKVDYSAAIRAGDCIACGDRVVDYSVIEEYVETLEEREGVKIAAIGYDRFNAMSTAQKLAADYNVVEIRQHSSVLHPATKLLKESILNRKMAYAPNTLLEINFQNARCTYDTNQNMYVNKKRSAGKIDMIAALIDAVYLLQQDFVYAGGEEFAVQVL